jgi:hypothetical protein
VQHRYYNVGITVVLQKLVINCVKLMHGGGIDQILRRLPLLKSIFIDTWSYMMLVRKVEGDFFRDLQTTVWFFMILSEG